MNLHEYQSKRLFADYGISVPRGIPADSADAAVHAAEELGGELWVVKAQAHTGGRGKAGGVKLAKTLDEVREFADEMLGMTLVTYQTGPEGLPVNVVYIEEGSRSIASCISACWWTASSAGSRLLPQRPVAWTLRR